MKWSQERSCQRDLISIYFQNIDVVCMPKPGDFQYQDKELKCYITGWGRRTESKAFSYPYQNLRPHLKYLASHERCRFQSKNLNIFSLLAASEHSLVLKEIHVPLWNHANCNGALQAQFGPAYTLPASAICAGAEGRDACDVSIYYTKHLLSICLIEFY